MRVFGLALFAWLLVGSSTEAQGGRYQIRQSNSSSSSYDEDGYRYSSQSRSSGPAGSAFVGLIGNDAQNVSTRVQWLAVGWGITDHLFGSAFVEHDFGDHVTLRASFIGGFSNHDHGKELTLGGDFGAWFHSRSLESIQENLLLHFNVDVNREYGPAVDRDGDGYDERRITTRTATSETSVNVPGYRSRMIGAEIGVGTWWGYNQTREEGGSRYDRGLIGYVYAGFASGWVKSSMYYVEGYGSIGKSRYHRVFIDLMYAPLVTYENLDDVDGDLQPPQFPVGLRLGVENIIGRRAAITLRAELLAIPAGGIGMALLTVGFGSMFTSAR